MLLRSHVRYARENYSIHRQSCHQIFKQLLHWSYHPSGGGGGGGGNSHMEEMGMLVGNFEFNP